MNENQSVENFVGMICYPSPVETSDEDRLWALICHLSGPIFIFVSAGLLCFLVPLIVWIAKKDQSPFLRKHSLESMSFSLTFMAIWFIIVVISFATMCIGIGFLLFFLVVPVLIAYLIWSILAGIKAYEGKVVEYPFSTQFVSFELR